MTKQMQTELSQTIVACAQEAVADAIETHRRMGRSIVVWKDGRVQHIKPKDIKPRVLPHDEWEKEN